MKKAVAAVCALGFALVAAHASASPILVTVTTVPAWDGATSVQQFGEINTATYGQTFFAAAPTLTGFTFYVDDFVNPDVVDFRAYVMGWNGSMATGPVLFSSGPLSSTNNGGAGGFEAFTIDTGHLVLSPGSQYVAFFSASGLFDGSNGTSRFGLVSGAYGSGDFVFLNNGNNFALVSTNAWSVFGGGTDLAFSAVFETPEPASLILLGIGLAGIAYRVRRRKS